MTLPAEGADNAFWSVPKKTNARIQVFSNKGYKKLREFFQFLKYPQVTLKTAY